MLRRPAPDPAPDPARAVVLDAQAVIFRASWRLLLDDAIQRERGRRGVVLASVFPPSDEIQVVLDQGREIGTVHLRRRPDDIRWVAVAPRAGRVGSYPTLDDAVLALLARRWHDD